MPKKTYSVLIFSPDTGPGLLDSAMRRGGFMRSLRAYATVHPVRDCSRIPPDEAALLNGWVVAGCPFLLGRAGNAFAVGFVFSNRRKAIAAAPILFEDTEAFDRWVAVALHQAADGSIEQVTPLPLPVSRAAADR